MSGVPGPTDSFLSGCLLPSAAPDAALPKGPGHGKARVGDLSPLRYHAEGLRGLFRGGHLYLLHQASRRGRRRVRQRVISVSVYLCLSNYPSIHASIRHPSAHASLHPSTVLTALLSSDSRENRSEVLCLRTLYLPTHNCLSLRLHTKQSYIVIFVVINFNLLRTYL